MNVIYSSFLQARETLSEIPNQFTSFMKANNIKPNPPPLRHQRSQASFQPNQGMDCTFTAYVPMATCRWMKIEKIYLTNTEGVPNPIPSSTKEGERVLYCDIQNAE